MGDAPLPSTRLRSSEIVIAGYFFYVALIAPFFIHGSWRAWAMAWGVTAVMLLMARFPTPPVQVFRDWFPLGATLVSFREMDWFTRPTGQHLENLWIVWDRALVDG